MPVSFFPRGKQTEQAAVRRETDERLAERTVRASRAAQGWDESRLRRSTRADPVKVRIACQVRVKTAGPLARIAGCLQTGSASYLAELPARQMKSKSIRTPV